MLYNKKLDLKNLHEWGSAVWVHTTTGTKLDGQSKTGKWIGFDETSKGHHMYILARKKKCNNRAQPQVFK